MQNAKRWKGDRAGGKKAVGLYAKMRDAAARAAGGALQIFAGRHTGLLPEDLGEIVGVGEAGSLAGVLRHGPELEEQGVGQGGDGQAALGCGGQDDALPDA